MSSTAVRGGGPLRAAVLWSSALISALLIIRALHLGYDLSRPVPFYDQWEFVRRIGDVLSGRFGFADLVAQHNEHRIATARLVFLLDLRLADGTGYLSIAVLYLALAAIAALLARCFAGDRGEATTVFLLSLALLLSPAQWENLSSGFQVQFPFVDLFAVLSLSCLIAALSAREGRRWAWLCLAAASLCDVLAVFSMASGTLLLIPALWIGLVLRSEARLFSAYVATHLAACALFAFHYARNAEIPPVFDPVLLLQYAIVYMGAALRGYPHGPFALGLLDLLCLSAALTSMLLRSRAGPGAVDRVQLFAASVALLLAANALLTAVGRSSFGVGSAVASRYAIQSLLLQPALLVVLWREGRHWLGTPASRSLLGAGLLAGGGALSLVTNLSDVSLREWRDRVDRLDRAGFAVAEGLFDDDVLRLVYPEPGSIRQAARQLVAQRLGPVSTRYGGLYRQPSQLPAGVDLDAVDVCRAAFGLAQDGSGSSRRLEGWAFDPRMPTGGGLAVVLDRSDGDRVVGLGRQSIRRDDVDRALDVSIDRSGFDIPLKIAADHRGGPTSLTLLIVPEQADRPVCAGTVSIPPEQR